MFIRIRRAGFREQIAYLEDVFALVSKKKFVLEGGPITDAEKNARKQKLRLIVVAYPFALLVISLGVNLFIFGVQPLEPSLPTREIFVALTVAAAGLLVNHSWLMTTTELTRSRFELYATPEEWTAAGKNRSQADQKGLKELERRHNTHRNATENTVYFAFLGVVFALASPPAFAAFVWIVGFAVARLGHTYGFLAGKDGVRGLFMSFSLLCLYGMASYLALALLTGS